MSTIIPFKAARRKPKIARIKCRKIGCRHCTRDPYAAKWVYLEDPAPKFAGWWEPECLEKLAFFWDKFRSLRLVRRASFVAVDPRSKNGGAK